MYQVPKTRKNASKKVTDNTISKRKKLVLNFVQREEIIQKSKNGYCAKKLALDFKVGLSTVYDIIAKGPAELSKFRKENPGSTIRCTFKTSHYPLTDQALKLWFYQVRGSNVPINYETVACQAKLFQREFYPEIENFGATSGFIQKFCKRHHIKATRLHGERQSADNDAVEPFLVEMAEIQKEYSLDQIYNADESGLIFKSLPNTTLATYEERRTNSASNTKHEKERITFLTCTNASASHALPLVFIHKVANPRCFQTGGIDRTTKKKKLLNKKDLPVIYKHSSNAWMTTEIFEEWFHEIFVPGVEKHLIEIGQEPKAVLLLDNCTCHPSVLISNSKKIKVVMLPPYTTSIIQPQDQGIIASVKKRFKAEVLKMYFQSYLANHPDTHPLQTFYNKYTIKDVIYLLASVWKSTPTTTLQRAWHKLNINIEVIDPTVVPTLPYQTVIPTQDIESWLQTEEGDNGYEILDTAGIIDRIRNPEPEQLNEHVEEDDDGTIQTSITASEINRAVFLCTQLSDLIHKAGGSEHIDNMFDLQAFLRNRQFEISTHQSTINF